MINSVDRNGDGRVDFAEFQCMMLDTRVFWESGSTAYISLQRTPTHLTLPIYPNNGKLFWEGQDSV
jgi:hypothetical protein